MDVSGPPGGATLPFFPKRQRIRAFRSNTAKHDIPVVMNGKLERVKTVDRINEIKKQFIDTFENVIQSGKLYDTIYVNAAIKPKTLLSRGITWSYDEISSINVPKICAQHALCFMWADSSNLVDVLKLMNLWGFAYLAIFKVLLKRYRNGQPLLGAGCLTKPSIDLLLCGAKPGTPVSLWKKKMIPEGQEYMAIITKTEPRPENMKRFIQEFFCPMRRIELFSANPTSGYDAWGIPYCNWFVSDPSNSQPLEPIVTIRRPHKRVRM